MKAIEFEGEFRPDQTLSVPAKVAAKLEPGQWVRVMVLLEDDDDRAEEDEAWARMGIEAIFSEEDPELDAAYNPPDQLPGG